MMNPALSEQHAQHLARRARINQGFVAVKVDVAARPSATVLPMVRSGSVIIPQHNAHVGVWWRSKRPNRERPRIATIIAVCADRFGVAKELVTSHHRHPETVKARHLAMYLARQMTARSFPDIGFAFGGKNHVTVIHAIQKVQRLMAEDVLDEAAFESLRAEILSRDGLAPMES